MSNRVSVVAFRVLVPAPTPASAPVKVKLSPICPALVELHIWTTTTPVMASSGWRAFTRDGQIIPDSGSNEAGYTYIEKEADWAPLPNVREKINLFDKELPGPPFDLELQFYSTAAIEVGGEIIARDPQYGIHDLVMHVSNLAKRLETIKREE